MEALERKIADLTVFRDEYFELHPDSNEQERRRTVREAALPLMQDIPIDSTTMVGGSRAVHSMLCGRILNICIEYDAKCEEFLTRSIKLDPGLVDAWIELGRCLWKKGDAQAAKTCFEQALTRRRDATALCCLSMAYRQEKVDTVEQRRMIIEKSLSFAHEAIDLEPQNAHAWYTYGNALLTTFFTFAQAKSKQLDAAISAYAKAIDLGTNSERYNADLHINYAMALQYEQRYAQCLLHLRTAIRLEPSFHDATDRLSTLTAYLARLHESVQRKGKLKPKRLAELVRSISSSDLGVYKHSPLPLLNGDSINIVPVELADLKIGINLNRVVGVKVVGIVPNEQSIPYTFTVCDRSAECFAISVYNFSPKFGVVIGDSIAILEPVVIEVNIDAIDNQPKISFRCIRVVMPDIIIRNGHKLTKEYVAFCTISLAIAP